MDDDERVGKVTNKKERKKEECHAVKTFVYVLSSSFWNEEGLED